MLVVSLLLSGCGAKRPPTATSAVVRGSVITVQLPSTEAKRDIIGVGEDKVAQRSFFPRPDPMATNSAIIPGPLWNELQALRQAWCTDATLCTWQADKR